MSTVPTSPSDGQTCPADLAGASPRELLDAWQGHTASLVEARHGIGTRQSPGRLRAQALDALAAGQALVDALCAARWITVLDALVNGASVDEIAAAAGLDADEVAVGLRSWADAQLALHEDSGGSLGIGPDEHARAYALLADA